MINTLTKPLLISILSTLLATDMAAARSTTIVSGTLALMNMAMTDQSTRLPSMVTISAASAFFAQNKNNDSGELHERDEIRQTFRLSPGTHVEVSNIRGQVEIETANIEVAEIHIVRSAPSRDDLEQFKIAIENKPESLIIRGEQRQSHSDSGFGPDVRHHVMLRLPRRIDLSIRNVSGQLQTSDVQGQIVVSSVGGHVGVGAVNGQVSVSNVSGDVTIGQVREWVEIKSVGGNVRIARVFGSLNISNVSGEVRINGVNGKLTVNSVGGALITGAADNQVQVSGGITIDQTNGQIEIKSVGGNVKIGQVVGFLDVSGVSGALSAGISKLVQSGVQINRVSGQVELRFSGELNAQLNTNSISGKVSIEVPNVTIQSSPGASAICAVIGKGGPLISINGVSQSVRVAQGTYKTN